MMVANTLNMYNNVTKSLCNYLTYKTEQCWCSVDSHVQEIVAMLSLTFLPIRAANTFNTHYSNQVTDSLPDLQNEKSLMLCWRSLSKWGMEHIAFSFDYKGSLYLIYECLQPIATQITQDAGRRMVEAPLTPIFRIGKGACVSCFWL